MQGKWLDHKVLYAYKISMDYAPSSFLLKAVCLKFCLVDKPFGLGEYTLVMSARIPKGKVF